MPRFVVLEHAWEGVHWDVMLERGGVLRTWAIDVPPAIGVDLRARGLPDHRALYLDYEGPISGDRGSVRRWDAGAYEVREWSDDRILVKLTGGQLVGLAEFRRVGEGGDDPRSRPDWILRLGKLI